MILSSSILDPLDYAIMVELCSLVIEVVFTEVSQLDDGTVWEDLYLRYRHPTEVA